MHLHFIFPRWQKLLEDRPELKEIVSGYDIGAFNMVGLGVAAASGALPEGVEVTLSDQNIEEIDYSVKADLVCISFFTPQATNAYAIADKFRANGTKTIAGGIHPTACPKETLEHFDSLVEGPVEGLWETVLSDLETDSLKRHYVGIKDAEFRGTRNDLFSSSDYLKAGVIRTSRGCHINCGFCVVPGCYGKKVIFRPVEDVISDIINLPFPCFFFADENLLFTDADQLSYTRKLLQTIIDRRIRKISFVASYPEFIKSISAADIKLMEQARLRQVYLVHGLMRPLSKELIDPKLREKIAIMKDSGIEMLASFTLGNDNETAEIGPLIEDYCKAVQINLAEFTLFTPFPGTASFEQMKRDNRILTERWEKYNGANVVFKPLNQSPEELEKLYLDMWKQFYGDISKEGIYTHYVKGFGGGVLRK